MTAMAGAIAPAPIQARPQFSQNQQSDVGRQLAEAERANNEARKTVERLRRSEAEARRAAKRAKMLAAGDRANAGAARKAADEAERRALADRNAAEAAARDANRAATALKQAQDREKKARGDSARDTLIRNVSIGGAAALVVLGALAFVLLRRRYRRALPPPVANAFLRSPTLNLHLPGARLPEKAGGVVVGRNPRLAEVVITARW
ncbi:MAG: hypothetical protein WDN44_00840 [Sphingomonas sp.]